MGLWRRRKPELQSTDMPSKPCPICAYNRLWDEYHGRPLRPIREQNSHVVSVEYDMCFEHYEVVSAHKWLEWTKYPPAKEFS